MIGIHNVHRRLAELAMKADKLDGWSKLPVFEQQEIIHCLTINAKLVYELDALKELSFFAYQMGDTDWQHELCKRIEDIEVKMI